MRDAELCRDPAGILHRAKRTAARAFGFRRAFLPDLHGDAENVVPLTQQQARRHRRIHPAAHRNYHCLLCVGHNLF